MKWKIALVVVIAACVGCGSSDEIPSGVAYKMRTSFEQGQDLVKQKNYESSIPLLSEAIDSGALAPMEVVEGLLLRAKSHLLTQQLELAMKDIELAERGVEDPAQTTQLHLLRSLYFKKSGDLTKAEIEYQKAVAIDPNAQPLSQ